VFGALPAGERVVHSIGGGFKVHPVVRLVSPIPIVVVRNPIAAAAAAAAGILDFAPEASFGFGTVFRRIDVAIDVSIDVAIGSAFVALASAGLALVRRFGGSAGCAGVSIVTAVGEFVQIDVGQKAGEFAFQVRRG